MCKKVLYQLFSFFYGSFNSGMFNKYTINQLPKSIQILYIVVYLNNSKRHHFFSNCILIYSQLKQVTRTKHNRKKVIDGLDQQHYTLPTAGLGYVVLTVFTKFFGLQSNHVVLSKNGKFLFHISTKIRGVFGLVF